MSDHVCPGCQDTLDRLSPDERNRIALRKAANAFYEANDKLFALVVERGWTHNSTIAADQAAKEADEALIMAAIKYAATRQPKPGSPTPGPHAEEDGAIPATLGLRIRVADPFGSDGSFDPMVFANAPVDSGFMLHRDQVEALRQQLEQWLKDNP